MELCFQRDDISALLHSYTKGRDEAVAYGDQRFRMMLKNCLAGPQVPYHIYALYLLLRHCIKTRDSSKSMDVKPASHDMPVCPCPGGLGGAAVPRGGGGVRADADR